MSLGTPAVKVSTLTKSYGRTVAVDHVSFEVSSGQVFGFLGPNGAGKTTTVRILTGVIRQDSGTATVMGHPAGSLSAKQLAGVVPEMANVYVDLSGWDNLLFMAKLYGMSAQEAETRADGLLRQLGLFDRKDSLARTYSKGMRQRLIVSMALMSSPRILFLDEPTSGLDVQSARLIKDMLLDLAAKGTTIFLTTHDMDEADELSDRVAIISKGQLVAIDAPEKLRLTTSRLHSVEVSFAEPVQSASLQDLPGVNSVKKLGDKYRLYTDSPGKVVTSLVDHCHSCALNIVSLRTLTPSLEDTFLALTHEETHDA